MRGYTTKQKIENYMLITIAASFDTQITAWIEAVEKIIEKMTGRIFIADTTASEKVYDGEGLCEQKFDEFISITKLTLGEDTETEVLATDYRIYPNNQENKNKIQLKYDWFERGNQNVHVTAKWGYSAACPADITLAATIIVAGIISYGSDKDAVKSESIGRYSVTYSTEQGWRDFEWAKETLQRYRRFSF